MSVGGDVTRKFAREMRAAIDKDLIGRATHIDPVAGVALDEAGKVVDANPLPATMALIDANIHKAAGRDPSVMTRQDYWRQGSSFAALGAALSPVPRLRRK
jgi:hypothetical protein